MSFPSAKLGDDATNPITLAMEKVKLDGLIEPDVTQLAKTSVPSSKNNVSANQPAKAYVYSKEELLGLRALGIDKPEELGNFTPQLKPIAEDLPKEAHTEPSQSLDELGNLKSSTKISALGVYKTKESDDFLPHSKDKVIVDIQPQKPIDDVHSKKPKIGEDPEMKNKADVHLSANVEPPKTVSFEADKGPDSEPDDEINDKPEPEIPQPKKKKKKSKSKSKKPTGFEEYYTDPPITPQEYKEESQDIYSSTRSFNERIELCIQRYRQKRNLDEFRALVYTKYLTLGGVDTGAKVGTGGLTSADFEDADAQQITAYTATDQISSAQNSKYYNSAEKDSWVVDFTAIVKGFLSYRAPLMFRSSDKDEIKGWTMVVRNFLNYVLLHNVCPEYTDDVLEARRICNVADYEHPRIALMGPSLPGDFNQACSTFFGGHYKGLHNHKTFTAMDGDSKFSYMTDKEAEHVVMTGIAMLGSVDLYDKALAASPKLTKAGFRSMQVAEIIPATVETITNYRAVKNTKGETGSLRSLGVLKLKHWDNPSALEEDLTEDEIANGVIVEHHLDTEIWLENDILDLCFVGMKIEAIFYELDVGLTYFDTVTGLYNSFYTFLENERMSHWKEPKINERPPPMVGDDMDMEGGDYDYDE